MILTAESVTKRERDEALVDAILNRGSGADPAATAGTVHIVNYREPLKGSSQVL